MPKTRKRPQSPKPRGSRSAVTLDAMLRSGAGVHKGQNYSRKVKHPANKWSED